MVRPFALARCQTPMRASARAVAAAMACYAAPVSNHSVTTQAYSPSIRLSPSATLLPLCTDHGSLTYVHACTGAWQYIYIIVHARTKYVCRYQSCMVYLLYSRRIVATTEMTDWEGGTRGFAMVGGGSVRLPSSVRGTSYDGLLHQTDLFVTIAKLGTAYRSYLRHKSFIHS